MASVCEAKIIRNLEKEGRALVSGLVGYQIVSFGVAVVFLVRDCVGRPFRAALVCPSRTLQILARAQNRLLL